MKNDMITLIAVDMGQDDAGFPKEAGRKETPVMAEVKSAKRMEYYESVKAGMNVQLMAAINREDYEAAGMEADAAAVTEADEAAGLKEGGRRRIRPTLAVHEGITYKIIRAFQKGRNIELSLQEVE